MTRPLPRLRDHYRYFHPIDLRWNDIDRFGHVNNTVFFELFDTAVNLWLAEIGLFQTEKNPMCVVTTRLQLFF